MKINKEKFYIVRTYSAGVWFCQIREISGTEATIINARRLWYWSGAASLSQMAIEGVKYPDKCKFTMTITDDDGVFLTNVIEVLPCSEEAMKNINDVPVWKI